MHAERLEQSNSQPLSEHIPSMFRAEKSPMGSMLLDRVTRCPKIHSQTQWSVHVAKENSIQNGVIVLPTEKVGLLWLSRCGRLAG